MHAIKITHIRIWVNVLCMNSLCIPGAKFRKYVGHSAHVTNVRFTANKQHVISVGGADHAIFQWRFVPPGGFEGTEGSAPLMGGVRMESDSEESDSDLSDVASVDSDLEREQETNYERLVIPCSRNY